MLIVLFLSFYDSYGGREKVLAATSTSRQISTGMENAGQSAVKEGKQLYQDVKDVAAK
jgi:hypothetical protein